MRVEADDLEREIQELEYELESSGTAQTAEDVEARLEALGTQM